MPCIFLLARNVQPKKSTSSVVRVYAKDAPMIPWDKKPICYALMDAYMKYVPCVQPKKSNIRVYGKDLHSKTHDSLGQEDHMLCPYGCLHEICPMCTPNDDD
jgi:hypothetical protein